MRFLIHLAAIGILQGLILDASAQSPRKVMFRTLCLDHVAGIETVFIPGGEQNNYQKIPLYTDVSPVIEGVFHANEVMFYRQLPPGPDGKAIWEPVGKAAIGKSERQLFLFSGNPAERATLPYAVRSFDDDTRNFAMGNVRAINLAPVPIRFSLAGELTPQIPPSKYAQFAHSTKVNEYNMYAVVVQFLSANGEWVDGQSVSWKATNRRRDIVISSVDLKFKQPTVQMFSDFPPWMETDPQPPTR